MEWGAAGAGWITHSGRRVTQGPGWFNAAMKLYVCYGTFKAAPRPGGHPCGVAHEALTEAGHEPEVIKSYGWGILPDFLNPSSGRREVRKLTGSNTVPVLVTDDGEVIQESREIKKWAEAHPAGATAG
jgi:hypothetical protein